MPAQNEISLLLVDDHTVFRHAMRLMLEKEDRFLVKGECSSGEEAIKACNKERFDVMLLDYSLEDMTAPRVAREVLSLHPDMPIVVLTMHEDEEYLQELFKIGIKAYILKKSSTTELFSAIDSALQGRPYIDPWFASKILRVSTDLPEQSARPASELLTRRELDVLGYLVFGFTNSETSRALDISPRTVEGHRANLMGKLNLGSRSELVQYALEHRLVDMDRFKQMMKSVK